MKNSIYSTAAGMLTSSDRLNIAANNLANVSTNGYKGDQVFEQTIRFLAEGPFPGKDQPVIGGTVLSMENGLIRHTDRPLDLAFEGPGFFAVQGPNNKELYTRNGAFNLNSQRELVNQEGYAILDKFGNKITISGNKFHFTSTGDIIMDDDYLTTLKTVDLKDKGNIVKTGDNFYTLKDGGQPPLLDSPQMQPGALEKSNVDMMKGISELMGVERTFEFQRTAADLVLRNIRRLISDIPRPI